MPRTNPGDVQAILGKDYDSHNKPSLSVRIRSAGIVVDRIIAYGLSQSDPVTLTSTEAADLEAWIAAHLYCVSDKAYQSRSTLGASASFQGQTAMGWDATLYGQTAKNLDPTGYLDAQDSGGEVGGFWLGKAPSEQIDYEDRD